uniref:Uncharacterized protein n=1 Tax=Arundo donax TaxID=35708 RepID=A0A0A9A3B7_ARUDO
MIEVRSIESNLPSSQACRHKFFKSLASTRSCSGPHCLLVGPRLDHSKLYKATTTPPRSKPPEKEPKLERRNGKSKQQSPNLPPRRRGRRKPRRKRIKAPAPASPHCPGSTPQNPCTDLSPSSTHNPFLGRE